jgi:transcriptional regulator with XRE-family HTH domain
MEITYSKDLSLYFDKLRYERNMTQETFVTGIVSIRQFRRYLKGECDIPQDIINQLSRRLGFKPEYVIFDFESERVNETTLITNFYNAVANKDYIAAEDYNKQIRSKYIIDDVNRLYYTHTVNLLEMNRNIISEELFLEKTIKLIDFPNILKNRMLSNSEIMILSTLMSLRSFNEKEKIAERLKLYISQPNLIVSGHSEQIVLLCLQRLSQYEGINENYTEVIRLCNQGVEISKNHKVYYLLEYFYYFLSLAYHKLGNIKKYEESVFRCYATLYAENNEKKIDKFTYLIEDDYKISLHKFVQEYIKKTYIKS